MSWREQLGVSQAVILAGLGARPRLVAVVADAVIGDVLPARAWPDGAGVKTARGALTGLIMEMLDGDGNGATQRMWASSAAHRRRRAAGTDGDQRG